MASELCFSPAVRYGFVVKVVFFERSLDEATAYVRLLVVIAVHLKETETVLIGKPSIWIRSLH
jgi:hypothetical protein